MKFRRPLMCAIVLSTSLTTPLALAQTAQIHHEVSLGIHAVDQQEIATNMAFAVALPFTL